MKNNKEKEILEYETPKLEIIEIEHAFASETLDNDDNPCSTCGVGDGEGGGWG
ncbi:MAG: hypothetical protein FWD66_01720 [Paludibacter sp.]|nr:hypothetical protein [Paludibacter sp.]